MQFVTVLKITEFCSCVPISDEALVVSYARRIQISCMCSTAAVTVFKWVFYVCATWMKPSPSNVRLYEGCHMFYLPADCDSV
jgi:hypothetical protein